MKRHRILMGFVVFIILCVGGILTFLRATAHSPTVGIPVSYSTHQIQGFVLSTDPPSWSPLLGYTLRYDIQINSESIYHIDESSEQFEHLDRFVDGQWYRLDRTYEAESIGHLTLDLGGEGHTGFHASLVQKYDGYGTRLDPGQYRLVLELYDSKNTPHYLACEFTID